MTSFPSSIVRTWDAAASKGPDYPVRPIVMMNHMVTIKQPQARSAVHTIVF